MCFFCMIKWQIIYEHRNSNGDAEKYKPIESRTGSVLFSSADPEILNIPFVRLAFGKECLTK